MRSFVTGLIILLTFLMSTMNVLACDECGCSSNMVKNVEMTYAEIPTSHPVDLIEGLNIELLMVPETRCAYMEGTVLGNMDELFGKVMAAAGVQGLFTADFKIGSMYPDDMSEGVDESTRVLCGMTIPADAEVSEPLMAGTIPAGMFLQVEHIGDYALLGDTYTKIYTWATENGVNFTPPTYEMYLTNPQTTPVDEWLTYIYLPFDHDAMKRAFKYKIKDHGEHGGHGDNSH